MKRRYVLEWTFIFADGSVERRARGFLARPCNMIRTARRMALGIGAKTVGVIDRSRKVMWVVYL